MKNFALIFNYMYLAIFGYQMLYFAVQYVVLKRVELFYYSIFLMIGTITEYVYIFPDILSANSGPSATMLFSSGRLAFQFCSGYFYILFIIHYLELYKNKPRLYYLLKYYKYYNLFFCFVFLLLNIFNVESHKFVSLVTLITQPINLVLLIMLWMLKGTYSKVVAYSSSCTVVGTVLTHIFINSSVNANKFYGSNAFVPAQLGLLLDIFILGYGLSLKAAASDKKLVKTLLENQQIADKERSRVAKDLHDGIGGMLSGIKLALGSISGNTVFPADNTFVLKRAISQLDNTIAEMRRVAHSMMPEALLRFGLCEAIQDLCDGINESKQVKMKFTQIGLNDTIEKPTEVTLYRIVQELTNNAIKHAAAKNIFIQLNKHEQGLTLTVEDDGAGFDMIQIKKGDGLQNVQSRVDYLKGNMEIQSKTGEGASFNIEIPK